MRPMGTALKGWGNPLRDWQSTLFRRAHPRAGPQRAQWANARFADYAHTCGNATKLVEKIGRRRFFFFPGGSSVHYAYTVHGSFFPRECDVRTGKNVNLVFERQFGSLKLAVCLKS